MMRGNLIIGAGGHGKIIADLMLSQGMKLIGFLDDNQSLIGQRIFELPVLGKSSEWEKFEPDGIVLAIGDNSIRSKILQKLTSNVMLPWITVVHPKAIVASSVKLGIGTTVMAGAIINCDAVLGDHTIINTGATVDHDCVIGDFVHIAPGVNLAGGVRVNNGAFLGIGSCVIPNCTIGENSVIGAGAVVIRDIPSNAVAKGVPARWDS
ncbi:MAG: acetyltransferase [Anaerolineae bacterium]|nr:acetyltransferase [Anaerolineae bacterium]